MTQFKITITSDTICPWCYIGYRRLQAAISQHLTRHPTDTFAISWRPFQLNPNAPRGKSVDKRTSYERRLGPEGTTLLFERLKSAAEGTGILFDFDGRTGNTLDCHRLVEYAGLQGNKPQRHTTGVEKGSGDVQTRVVEELFAGYFERGRDVTSQGFLIEAAARTGLDREAVARFLASEEMVREVEEQAGECRGEGITGVPYFDINDVFSVQGAQEPAAFLMLFERLKKREMNRGGSML